MTVLLPVYSCREHGNRETDRQTDRPSQGLNGSTEVQNPRHMCSLASDGIMKIISFEVQLYSNCQNDAQLHALLSHKLILLPSHLSAQTILLNVHLSNKYTHSTYTVLRKIGNRPGACGYKEGVAGQGICQYGAQIQKTKENLRS